MINLGMGNFKNGEWITKLLTPGILIILLTLAIQLGQHIANLESRTLDSVEFKIKLQDHLKDSWDQIRSYKLEQELLMTRKEVKALKVSDSLSAIERGQFKSILLRIEEKLEQIN